MKAKQIEAKIKKFHKQMQVQLDADLALQDTKVKGLTQVIVTASNAIEVAENEKVQAIHVSSRFNLFNNE